MFSLGQFSLSVATIAATVTISAVCSTVAQAAIVGGQVSGIWQYDYDGAGGLNVGDAFTANYTYDSDSLTTYDYSDDSYSRYLIDSVPLLSLMLNSGAASHAFDLSNSSSYSYLQWIDIQQNPAYGQYRDKSTSLYANDYSAPGNNNFYAYSLSGQYSDDIPFSSSLAYFYSYDSSTSTYPANAYTYGGVTFSSSSPTPVPTPALLPGLVGLGLGVLRKRKAVQAQTVSE